MLREALKISIPLALVSREVPRFHGGSLWHSTPVLKGPYRANKIIIHSQVVWNENNFLP